MGFLNKIKKLKSIEEVMETKKEKLTPYEKREAVQPLSVIVTIMNRGQSDYYIDAYQKAGASMSMDLYGYSMPPEEFRHIMGVDTTKKEILLTFVRADLVNSLLSIATERFKISAQTKGIAFACPIDAVSGIAAYKFLADQHEETKLHGNGNNQL